MLTVLAMPGRAPACALTGPRAVAPRRRGARRLTRLLSAAQAKEGVEPELHKVSFKRSGHSAVLETQLVLDKVRRKREKKKSLPSLQQAQLMQPGWTMSLSWCHLAGQT
jgi:hypothetical protein